VGTCTLGVDEKPEILLKSWQPPHWVVDCSTFVCTKTLKCRCPQHEILKPEIPAPCSVGLPRGGGQDFRISGFHTSRYCSPTTQPRHEILKSWHPPTGRLQRFCGCENPDPAKQIRRAGISGFHGWVEGGSGFSHAKVLQSYHPTPA